MTDRDAFLRTILDAPDDDAPRLVYADWLEERGETKLAEFIRVQVELAAMPKLSDNCTRFHLAKGYCKQCKPQKALRRREAELLKRHGREWATAIMQPAFRGLHIGPYHTLPTVLASWQWLCGFPSVITLTCEQLMGRVCERCQGTGTSPAGPAWEGVQCPACHSTGRLPPLGPAIAAVCPVRKWVLTDKRPYAPLNGHYWWHRNPHGYEVVGPELFDLLTDFDPKLRHDRGKGYLTEDAAQAALSDAVNAHVRPLAAELRRLAPVRATAAVLHELAHVALPADDF